MGRVFIRPDGTLRLLAVGVVAVVVWLLTAVIPGGWHEVIPTLLGTILLLISVLFIQPFLKIEAGGVTVQIEGLQDWIGLILLLLVIVALIKGVDPVQLIKIICDIGTKLSPAGTSPSPSSS